MSGEWKGALHIEHLDPAFSCRSQLRQHVPTAPACPAMTICPDIEVRGRTTSPGEAASASAQMAVTVVGVEHMTAAMDPTPGCTAPASPCRARRTRAHRIFDGDGTGGGQRRVLPDAPRQGRSGKLESVRAGRPAPRSWWRGSAGWRVGGEGERLLRPRIDQIGDFSPRASSTRARPRAQPRTQGRCPWPCHGFVSLTREQPRELRAGRASGQGRTPSQFSRASWRGGRDLASGRRSRRPSRRGGDARLAAVRAGDGWMAVTCRDWRGAYCAGTAGSSLGTPRRLLFLRFLRRSRGKRRGSTDSRCSALELARGAHTWALSEHKGSSGFANELIPNHFVQNDVFLRTTPCRSKKGPTQTRLSPTKPYFFVGALRHLGRQNVILDEGFG